MSCENNNNYRVISFATHALVAGGLDGLTEPALVLTPGTDEHNPKNDNGHSRDQHVS
jgi:hypothetical protein